MKIGYSLVVVPSLAFCAVAVAQDIKKEETATPVVAEVSAPKFMQSLIVQPDLSTSFQNRSITNKTFNAATGVETAKTSSKDNSVVLDRIRFNIMGKVNEGLSWRVRFRFDKSTDPKTVIYSSNAIPVTAKTTVITDNAGPALDYYYADIKPMDMLAIRVGKQPSNAWGFEDIRSLHTGSDTANALPSAITALRADIIPMAGQQLGLFVANAPTLKISESYSAQKVPMFGVVYDGKMLDKMLSLRASYFYETIKSNDNTATGASAKDRVNTYIAAGAMVNAAGVGLQLDYKMYTKPNATADSGKETLANSMSGHIDYVYDVYKPYFEGVLDTNNVKATKVVTTKLDMIAGLEFRPALLGGGAAYLAYVMPTSTVKADTKKTAEGTTQMIKVGFIYAAPLTK